MKTYPYSRDFVLNAARNKARQQLVDPKNGILGVYMNRKEELVFLVNSDEAEEILPVEFEGFPVEVIHALSTPLEGRV